MIRREHDFRAGLAEDHHGEEHGHLAARNDQNPTRIDGNAMALFQIGGDRFTESRNTVGRRIAVMSVMQGLDRCFDDVVRGSEVGLANAEIDDAAAFGGQFVGSRQNGECGFRS